MLIHLSQRLAQPATQHRPFFFAALENGAVASATGRVYVWGGGAWEGGIGNANGEDVSEVSWNGVPPCYACRGVALGHKHGFLVFEKGVRGGA